MFWTNIKIAIINLRKNRLFATVNIAGLAIGMTIYVFGGLLAEYENTHDAFFKNSDRTFTVGSYAAPQLNVGFDRTGSTFSAIGPLIEAELQDVEAVARTLHIQYLVTVDDKSFYEMINFADPALLDIFDLKYIEGNNQALQKPTEMVITETMAVKYFGSTDVVGDVITLDNEYDFRVAAVVNDIPKNSHFNSAAGVAGSLGIIAPIQALGPMRDFEIAGGWDNLSIGNKTYVMLPESLNGEWLQTQVDGIFDRHTSAKNRGLISGLMIEPLQRAHLSMWDSIGIPAILIVQLLGFLVLMIACVNYMNLATAQSLGRSREVGMRKTLGASRIQLLSQFLVESLVIASISMIVAIAILEVIIPLFNNVANKVMTLDYLRTLPWLVTTTILVGLLAGLYPAWLITRASPIDALRDIARKGKKGSIVRAIMIGTQFAISAFMLALVSIVYMQSERVKEASYIFPRSEIYTLDRLSVDDVHEQLEILQHELEALPNISSVAYSSQVPFEQSTWPFSGTAKPGDEASKFSANQLKITPKFLVTYDIPLLAGRNLNKDIANDEYRKEESEVINVIVNELFITKLGISSPQEAINTSFYDLDEESTLRELVIVGVVPTQNILGTFNAEKPFVFSWSEPDIRIGSIRITGGNITATVEAIENVWKRVIPDYPMQGRFLDDTFNDVYKRLKFMNVALGGFAFIALSLAMIGLFGLSAFMATQRTKEIGIRKVLGASSAQIARLLVWQFSKPAMWALTLALPAAYFASNIYLDFFADRIESPFGILIVAGALAVVLAWCAVAGHAIRIARANPVLALRYE